MVDRCALRVPWGPALLCNGGPHLWTLRTHLGSPFLLVIWLPDAPADLWWMWGLVKSTALEIHSRTKAQLLRLVRGSHYALYGGQEDPLLCDLCQSCVAPNVPVRPCASHFLVLETSGSGQPGSLRALGRTQKSAWAQCHRVPQGFHTVRVALPFVNPQALKLRVITGSLRSLPVTVVKDTAPSSPGKLLPWPCPQSCGPPSGL
ncbi:Hypothetical predicted protein [Marmota monax]|uniref:Uncharacterized protein n=1 Tax=Marmota monax TaxID=9995 RepID=A0A5E4CL40_MARMO|nr:Hypothetical predicted protein [Marmota monax]